MTTCVPKRVRDFMPVFDKQQNQISSCDSITAHKEFIY